MRYLLLLWLCWLLQPCAAATPVVALDTTRITEIRLVEKLTDTRPRAPLLQPEAGEGTLVPLPDHWPHGQNEFQGVAWYRLILRSEYDPGLTPTTALRILRASTNLQVWFNDVRILRSGAMPDEGPEAHHWNTPLLYRLPSSAWRSGDNIIWLRLLVHPERGSGLSTLLIGPEHLMLPGHERQRWIQNHLGNC